ncbi:MAG: MobC family plasmid mobilization relaxosome protein [Agathobacter sp.]|nr:MobC family plasmid mobilization relaxosome protein [Agathobacter sp.]MBP3568118.1 MobC family plasmid mobilization relaxosome protein [Lachnospiraceae bacterium]
MKRRIVKKTVRFTQEEYVSLQEDMNKRKDHVPGKDDFSTYAREKLLAKSYYQNLRIQREINELRYEIRKIGVNINQIAKKINGGFGTRNDLIVIIKRLDEIEQLMDSYEKKVEDSWQSQN